MEVMTFVVPCLFGLEGLAAEELRRLGPGLRPGGKWPGPVSGRSGGHGHGQLVATDRRADAFAPAKGPARSFEELFQIVATTPLEEVIPRDGKFPVKGHSLNSQLHSVPTARPL